MSTHDHHGRSIDCDPFLPTTPDIYSLETTIRRCFGLLWRMCRPASDRSVVAIAIAEPPVVFFACILVVLEE